MKLIVCFITVLTLAACSTDPGKDKVAATIENTPVALETQAAAAPKAVSGHQYTVALQRSKLSAVGAKISAEHPIVFHSYTANITVDGDQVTGVTYTTDMAKLEADHPRLTEHLLNEDFFWVEQYPTSSFISTEVTSKVDQVSGMTHTVTGDLSIRGVTKRVSFPAKITLSGTEVSAETEFVINRQDFGVTYPGRKDDLIKDNVLMQINFVAPRG
jgi:polyisoprenoid-binding protein YceI